MKKSQITINDVVEFKNGKTVTITKENMWILQEYYDDNLVCLTNDEYSIVKVYQIKKTKVLKK